MANKKISELQSRTPALSDLMLVGDPSSGYSYKCTVTALATIIETDIADGYVTIGTTQTISGAKTFSNNLTLTSVANATTTQTKFLTLNGSNVVNYRTGAEVLADIGGQGTISLAAIGSTPNANGATLSSNTLTLQPASASFGGVLTTGFQEIAGWKRFTGNPIQFDNHLEIKNLNSWGVSWGYTSFASKDTPVFGFLRGHSSTGSVTYNAWFTYGTTGDRNYTLPSSDGTLALTSQVPTVSGTTNYVAKFTSSSAIGNSQIFDNGTSVGINTATPNEKLEVSGVVRVSRTTSASAYLNLTIENGVAGFDARGSIDQVFYTGALERMRLTFGGNLGIGTSNPTTALDVNGAIKTNNNVELTSSTPTILWTTSNLRFYNNTNGVVATISDIGQLTLSSIPNATTDTDKFLVSDGGVVKYRTGSEVLSDIGGASSSSISGTTNYIPKFTSSSAIGNSLLTDDGTTLSYGSNIASIGATNTSEKYLQFNYTAGNFFVGGTNGENYIYGAGSKPITFYTNSSERMRLDASGNLGLGTSSPDASYMATISSNTDYKGLLITGSGHQLLQVQSTTSARQAVLALKNGGQQYSLTLDTDNALKIYDNTSAATRLTLSTSGNLGLGVTPSAWGSSFKAMQLNNVGVITASGTNNVTLANNWYDDGALDKYIINGFASRYILTSSGTHRWDIAPSGSANGTISFTQAMTLDASGRLGIGTTSPSAKLQIKQSTSNWYDGIRVFDGSSNMWIGIGNTGSAAVLASSYDNSGSFLPLAFYTSDLERMRITSGGQVGIGIAPTGSWGLQMYGNGTANTVARIQLQNSSTGSADTDGGGISMEGVDFVTRNNESGVVKWEMGGSERMRITSGGQVGIGTSSPASYEFDGTAPLVIANSTNTTFTIASGTSSKGYIAFADGTSGAARYTGNINYNHSNNSMNFEVNGGATAFTITSAQNAEFAGSIKTAAPSGGNAAAWKLGERVASSGLTLNDTQYIQLDIAGTLYTLATVNLP